MRIIRQLRYLRPSLRKMWGMLAIAGVVTLLVSMIALLPPYLVKLLFDYGIAAGDISTIIFYGLLAIGAHLLTSVLGFAGEALFSVTGARFIMNVKSQALERLLGMRLEFFDKHESGYLAERFNEVDMLNAFISPMIFQFFGSIIQFSGALLIMARISGEITIVALFFVPIFYLITHRMSSAIKKTSETLMEVGAEMRGKLQETISGIGEIKHSTAEGRRADEAKNQFDTLASQEIKQSIFMGLGMESIGFLTNLVTVIVIVLSGIFIVRGEMTMGDYVAMGLYVGMLFAPASLFGTFVLTIQPAIVALERLTPIFEEKTEQELSGNKRIRKLEGAISFDRVTFAYESGKERVLKGCSFSIAPGECVAILGRNRAGKSTLVKLMLGFYAGYNGEIFIDGTELRRYDISSLRKRVGLVSQNLVLFSGSLWENVKMAGPAASNEAVEQALSLSGCRDVFDGDLSEIHIAESGKTLSGGQRQAVAIARCLLKEPDVLIFDEATAHLDGSTRQVVMHAFKEVFAQKTRILITHDGELAKAADTVLLLENGVVNRITPSKIGLLGEDG